MKIISWQQFLTNILVDSGKKTSMTVGVFDGVHLGHRSLLEKIVSRDLDLIPVVLTFKENYKGVGSREWGVGNEIREIQSFDERLAEFEKMGIQVTIVIDFTNEFKRIPGVEFLNTILQHGNIGFFAVGGDFRCGYGLDTDATAIKKFFETRGIPTQIVPQVLHNGQPISSSRIRKALASGNDELAKEMLG